MVALWLNMLGFDAAMRVYEPRRKLLLLENKINGKPISTYDYFIPKIRYFCDIKPYILAPPCAKI